MKRAFKILGISFAAVLGVIAVAVIVVAIRGGFSGKQKQLDALTVLVNNVETTEALVNDDFTITLNYTPADAQALDIKVSADQFGESVIDSVPSRVTAGVPFKVRLARDNQNHANGGEVKFTFESDNRMIRRNLKVMVDVELTEQMLNYSANTSGITYNDVTDKYGVTVSPSVTNKMGVSSDLAHSINPKVGFITFESELRNIANKKAFTIIKNLDTEQTSTSLAGGTVVNRDVGTYDINLQAVNSSSNVKLVTYVHRLYEIQNDFVDSWFGTIMNLHTGNVFGSAEAYNAFLNKHLAHFTKTEEGRTFFEDNTHEVEKEVDGQIVIVNEVEIAASDIDALQQSLKYVFVTVNANFVVADVQIGGFTQAEYVPVNVLNPYTASTLEDMASSKFGLTIEPIDGQKSEENYQILRGKLANVEMGTYIVYGEDGSIAPTSGLDDLVDGHPKYIEYEEHWYEYNTEFVSIEKESTEASASWTVTPYYPNYVSNDYSANDYIGGRSKHVYAIYSVINIDAEGDKTTKYGKSEIQVLYTPNRILFDNYDLNKKLVVTTLKDDSEQGGYFVGYGDYTVNKMSAISATSNIIAEKVKLDPTAVDNSEYTTVWWFVAYDSNYTSDNIQIIKTRNTHTSGDNIKDETTDIIDYLSNVDGSLFSKNGYTKWDYLGNDISLVIEAINANTDMRNMSISGVKLYAMRMVTDSNGNVLTQIVDGKTTHIVSSCVESAININATYMFSSADDLYVYYIDNGDYTRYVPSITYTPSDNGDYVDDGDGGYREATEEEKADPLITKYKRIVTYDTLVFSQGGGVELFVSPFMLNSSGAIDGVSNYSTEELNNLRIALFNYNQKWYAHTSSYIKLGASGILASPVIDDDLDIESLTYISVSWTAQDTSDDPFNIEFVIMDTSAGVDPDSELYRESNPHPSLYVKVKIQ